MSIAGNYFLGNYFLNKSPATLIGAVGLSSRTRSENPLASQNKNDGALTRLAEVVDKIGGQAKTAAFLGVSERNVRNYLSGRVPIKATALTSLSLEAGISPKWVRNGTGPKGLSPEIVASYKALTDQFGPVLLAVQRLEPVALMARQIEHATQEASKWATLGNLVRGRIENAYRSLGLNPTPEEMNDIAGGLIDRILAVSEEPSEWTTIADAVVGSHADALAVAARKTTRRQKAP